MGIDDDLRDEVEFHIDKRAESHLKRGMAPDEAEALARKQFGDVEAVMSEMRRARMGSARAALVVLGFVSVMTAATWLYVTSVADAPVVFPGIAEVPRPMKFVKRPPPPPPPPTWEEFVAKVNTFGDGSRRPRRR